MKAFQANRIEVLPPPSNNQSEATATAAEWTMLLPGVASVHFPSGSIPQGQQVMVDAEATEDADEAFETIGHSVFQVAIRSYEVIINSGL
ncbi:MAG TPA: hypothetical protein VMR50_16540, partial [Myxococcota bacterium]|nr:hypothetical protein [Myxococcota bacterium]